jgi:predicted nucleic acid-binding protein
MTNDILRYLISFWDALIVSAAQVGGCRYLLTEVLQETQMFENLTVVNPFHTISESLIM